MATDVLRGALNTDAKSPVERFGGVLTGGSIQERGKEARKAMPTIMQESAQAAGQAKRAELEATSQQLGREAAAEEEAATKLRTETERIRGLEQPYQEFKAPEYTAADYAKGAAKRALVGVLLGGIAKTSAMTQLKAIKAMQDAERDGRTQDFEKARLSFDEAEKKRVDFNQRLQTELSDFQQLLGKDTAAAKLKAKMMTAQMMDGLASAAERNQNYKQFMEVIKNATDQSNELEMEAFKQKGRLEEAIAKEAAKGEGAGLKPGVTATDRFSMRVKLKSISDRMQEMLQKPEFQNKLDNYRLDLFLQEQSPYLDQLLQSEIPEDVRSFAILAKTFRNQKYREESGLAVTSYEQLRQYGAVPQPGDSSKVLSDKLKTLDTGLINDINTDLKIYPALRNVGEALGYGKQTPESPKPLTDDERRRLNELRQRQKEKANSGQ